MCSPQTYVYHHTFPVLTHTLVIVQFWDVERDYIINEITLSINISIFPFTLTTSLSMQMNVLDSFSILSSY